MNKNHYHKIRRRKTPITLRRIKLLRNNSLDESLRLKVGTFLNSDILQQVLSIYNGDLKLCHKLKPEFISLKRNARHVTKIIRLR